MFFVNSENMPDGLGFQTFDLTHILWLLLGAAVCVVACILYRRLSDRQRRLVCIVLGSYIFFQEMLKNLER